MRGLSFIVLLETSLGREVVLLQSLEFHRADPEMVVRLSLLPGLDAFTANTSACEWGSSFCPLTKDTLDGCLFHLQRLSELVLRIKTQPGRVGPACSPAPPARAYAA